MVWVAAGQVGNRHPEKWLGFGVGKVGAGVGPVVGSCWWWEVVVVVGSWWKVTNDEGMSD